MKQQTHHGFTVSRAHGPRQLNRPFTRSVYLQPTDQHLRWERSIRGGKQEYVRANGREGESDRETRRTGAGAKPLQLWRQLMSRRSLGAELATTTQRTLSSCITGDS
ncbi:hypothetical protein BaRGS_00027731, partial [Batillaria attramentaria]